MRTTLNIEDELVRAAKIEAVRRGITLTALIEEGLRKALESPVGEAKRVTLPVFSSRPNPEVDFTSTSELLEELEGPFARP